MTKKKKYAPQEPSRKSARLASMEKKETTIKTSPKQSETTPKLSDITKASLGHCSNPPLAITPQESPSFQQATQHSKLEEGSTKNFYQRVPSPPQESLPPYNAMEMLLANLVKNDKHNIFAEPVDPKKVPGYGNIIKEPMNFATLKKKLQNGLYKNMQQFERDVFLIFEYAMKFNPPTTIFYKEAHQLQEEAKNAFTALRFHYSNMKAKNDQILTEQQHQYGLVTHSARTKNLGGPKVGATHAGSTFTRSQGAYIGQGEKVYAHRSRYGSDSAYGERRYTYRPWTSANAVGDDIDTILNHASKVLVTANDDIGSAYNDSLMRFVKDLGPTAKSVANKMMGSFEISNGQSKIPWPVTNLSSQLFHENSMLAQTTLDGDAYGHNDANVGTWGAKRTRTSTRRNIMSSANQTTDADSSRNTNDIVGNTDLLSISLKHHLAQKLVKTITPPTAQTVMNALRGFLSDQLIEWYMTPAQYRPNYNVQVTNVTSSMPAQEGFAPATDMGTMQNQKGKDILPTENVNYRGNYAQQVNEGDMRSRVLGEQFPGLNAMMQRAMQVASTPVGAPSMETLTSLHGRQNSGSRNN